MQGAVFVEGNGSVEEQVVVANAIHGSVAEQQADVGLQLLADTERVVQLLDKVTLFRGEPGRRYHP